MTQPKRVWLIDDDEDDSFFFETALEEIIPPVDFSADRDSVEALSKLSDNNCRVPDLLFLDWNMPKMSGRDCLKAIRKLPAYDSVPIIIYSTSNAHPDKVDAQSLGASYFLTKPPSLRELVKNLKYLLSIDWSNANV